MSWLRAIKDLAILTATIALPLLLHALSDWATGDDQGPGSAEGG